MRRMVDGFLHANARKIRPLSVASVPPAAVSVFHLYIQRFKGIKPPHFKSHCSYILKLITIPDPCHLRLI